MKRRWICLAGFFLMAVLLAAAPVQAAKKVKRWKGKTFTLEKGKSLVLKAPGKGKTRWKSSRKKVASMSRKGKVKARKKGKTVITARCGGKRWRCTVKVVKKRRKKSCSRCPETGGDPQETEARGLPKEEGTEPGIPAGKENTGPAAESTGTVPSEPSEKESGPDPSCMPFSFRDGGERTVDLNTDFLLKLDCESDFPDGWHTDWHVSDESVLTCSFGGYDTGYFHACEAGDAVVTAQNAGRIAQITIHVEAEEENDYFYEARILNHPSYHLYCCNYGYVHQNCEVIIFLKTQNPKEASLSWDISRSEGETSGITASSLPYRDISGWGAMTDGFDPVKGGYVLQYETDTPGEKQIIFYETANHIRKEAARITFTVENGNAACRSFFQQIAAESVSPGMGNVERAAACRDWILTHFIYERTDPAGRAFLLVSDVGPIWERRLLECGAATALMRTMLEELGIESGMYVNGSHVAATGQIEGEEIIFDACPEKETGVTVWEGEVLNERP